MGILDLICFSLGDFRRQNGPGNLRRKYDCQLYRHASLMLTLINNVHLQRGGYRELVSGTTNGVVELWDIRSQNAVLSFVDEGQRGSGQKIMSTMTSMQVHEHAPVVATGTKQIKIWTTSGDLLSSFKNTGHSHAIGVAGTLATGITNARFSSSFLSSLAFHPHRMMLAATSSHDTNINIYQCHDTRTDCVYH